MKRPVILLLAGLLVIAAAAGACSDSDSSGGDGAASSGSAAATGKRVTIDGSEALVWGDGPYGVVLAHGAAFDAASWEAQATRIADGGATVVAVEDISPEGIQAAVGYLQNERSIPDVALVGGSAGADAILTVASEEPELPDQLILLSPNRTVEGLGEEPKLFIASEGEGVADVSQELAATAPGSDNLAQIVPGSAHAQNLFDTDQAEPVTQAILDRLAQFSSS